MSSFSLLMLNFLVALLATLSSILRSRAALELENVALRHQIGILQRSARKRPKLTPWDRLLWVWFSRIWSDWPSALAIVQPETVVAWHRAGFRLVVHQNLAQGFEAFAHGVQLHRVSRDWLAAEGLALGMTW